MKVFSRASKELDACNDKLIQLIEEGEREEATNLANAMINLCDEIREEAVVIALENGLDVIP